MDANNSIVYSYTKWIEQAEQSQEPPVQHFKMYIVYFARELQKDMRHYITTQTHSTTDPKIKTEIESAHTWVQKMITDYNLPQSFSRIGHYIQYFYLLNSLLCDSFKQYLLDHCPEGVVRQKTPLTEALVALKISIVPFFIGDMLADIWGVAQVEPFFSVDTEDTQNSATTDSTVFGAIAKWIDDYNKPHSFQHFTLWQKFKQKSDEHSRPIQTATITATDMKYPEGYVGPKYPDGKMTFAINLGMLGSEQHHNILIYVPYDIDQFDKWMKSQGSEKS